MEICVMVAKLVSAAALLAFAGTAVAGPFAVKLVDANPESRGDAIQAPGALYQETNFHDSDFSPNNALIGAFGAAISEDSYVTIDGIGPSTATRTAAGPAQAINTGGGASIFTSNSLSGTWFFTAPDGTASSPNALFGGAEAVFLARMTSTAAGDLTLGARGVVVDIVDDATDDTGSTNSLLASFTAFDTNVTEGQDGGDLTFGPLAKAYQLKVVSTQGENGTVYDIYVVNIPTPGAAALLGFAGFAAIRRRR